MQYYFCFRYNMHIYEIVIIRCRLHQEIEILLSLLLVAFGPDDPDWPHVIIDFPFWGI